MINRRSFFGALGKAMAAVGLGRFAPASSDVVISVKNETGGTIGKGGRVVSMWVNGKWVAVWQTDLPPVTITPSCDAAPVSAIIRDMADAQRQAEQHQRDIERIRQRLNRSRHG